MEEEKKIFCKEEHIPLTKTRKKFLKEFIKKRPTTYNEDGSVQCYAKRHRSVSELHQLVQSRFKKTSLKAVVRILDELNKEGSSYMMYCTTIHKYVIKGGVDKNTYSEKFLSKYSKKYYSNEKGEDDISYNQILNIKRELEEENRDKDNPVAPIKEAL